MNSLETLYKESLAEWKSLAESETPVFFVGAATCGRAAGAGEVLGYLREELPRRALEAAVVEVGCLGPCFLEPLVIVQKPGMPGICYGNVGVSEIETILESYVLGADPCGHLALGAMGPGGPDGIPPLSDHPVMKRQVRRVLRNCGIIDPENVHHYLAMNGYRGFLRAIELGPDATLDEVKRSGLRGRGGAGFPTWRKWEFCRSVSSDTRYLICNADEGDPGAFMNRSLLEGDPHAVLEGMLIAGYAMGSTHGYVYCRAEYPLAIRRLETAIGKMREMGLLGENILGSGFSFDIGIKKGAGAFVCGEETALIASMEGRRGMPRPRPPFPAVSGLWGKPTVIQNVETLGNLPLILYNGAGWYTEYGSENSKGTKTFALAGKVKRTGLVEVPLGMTLRDIIDDIGGGTATGKPLKAVQTGGPSGGCIPASMMDLPVDYEALAKAGSIMGSGGMIVLDEDTCVVDLSKYFLSFTQAESCGKCPPCRVGTRAMLSILTAITEGRAEIKDLETLENVALTVKNGALCGLGQTAPNPVLSTIRYFREEYETHIKEKRCPAVVCSSLFKSPCQHACPIGMDIPSYVALVRAGRLEDAYSVLVRTNPFPAVCGRVCDHRCQFKCRRAASDGAVSIKYLKRFITDNASRPEVKPAEVTRAEKVAVIGGGPAGLTAARDLALMGYGVVVFEGRAEAGGWLRWGIPDYRLPRDVLKAEISDIEALGVEIRTGVKVGSDMSFKDIDEVFDYVFLGVGALGSTKLKVSGEDLDGVHGGVEFLLDFNTDPDAWLNGDRALGDRVVVIGGGNTAIDAARTAVRLGSDVTIVYRRDRKNMRAEEAEIEAAEQEGVKIQYLAGPMEIIGGSGRVKAVKFQKMVLGDFDASGRRRPVAVEGEVFTVDADAVIAAIGQFTDTSFIPDESGIGVNRWSYVETAEGSGTRTGNARYFAGGDAVTGPATVIEAIAAGHRAAKEIDAAARRAKGEAPYQAPAEEEIEIPFIIEEEDQDIAPAAMPELDVESRRRNFSEVELGFDAETAVREAARCLRCDAEIEE